MNRLRGWLRPRTLGVVVALGAAAVMLTGVATALAAGTPTATPSTGAGGAVQSFVDRLAQNLGISTDQLNGAIKTTDKQMIDEAASSGKITQDQANQLKQKVDNAQGTAPFLFGVGGGHGRMGMGMGPGPGMGVNPSELASAIGITESQLRSDLQSGKTISDIIGANGKTAAGVVDAVVAQQKAKLDQAVQHGKLTSDQESQLLANLKTRLTDAINNNTIGAERGHGFGPFGGHRFFKSAPANPGGNNNGSTSSPTG